jgi:hypothetical protein
VTEAYPENSKTALEEMEAPVFTFEENLDIMEAKDLEETSEATEAVDEPQELR